MGTQEGHVGDTDKGPLLTGPESDDWTLLGYLRGSIKVGEAHAAQVCGKADEDVPAREESSEPGAGSDRAVADTCVSLGHRPPLLSLPSRGQGRDSQRSPKGYDKS